MISRELEIVLRRSGWYPGRNVSTSAWSEVLSSYGYEVLPEAMALLQEFGGLTIEPVRTRSDAFRGHTIIFDPLSDAEPDGVAHWQQILGTPLTPIGQLNGDIILLFAVNGSIFSSWARFLFRVGDSLEDALENTLVFARRKPVEVASTSVSRDPWLSWETGDQPRESGSQG